MVIPLFKEVIKEVFQKVLKFEVMVFSWPQIITIIFKLILYIIQLLSYTHINSF